MIDSANRLALTLSKRVPARTKTIEFNWCYRNFAEMSPQFREIRARMSNPLDACAWCSHKFQDGEMMTLAQPKTGTNKVLCQQCANDLLGPA